MLWNCLRSEIFFQAYLSLISYPYPLQWIWVSKIQNLGITIILSWATLHIMEMTTCKCSPVSTTATFAQMSVNVCEDVCMSVKTVQILTDPLPYPTSSQWPGLIFTPKYQSKISFFFSLQVHSLPLAFTPQKIRCIHIITN